MPMRSTTVRFDEELWEVLAGEAAAGGVSTAQFVRDAAVLRLGYLAGRRGDERARTTLATVAARGQGRATPAHPALLDHRRLERLRRTGLLDSDPDPTFDRLTRIAARALRAPGALVSLIDRDRHFFKSCLGVPEPWSSTRELPLTHSFCQHVVISREPMVIPDAREHPDLRDSPAIAELGVIAYLGIPLITSDGAALGSLCVIDQRPRHWSQEEVGLLRELAAAVLEEIEAAAGPTSAERKSAAGPGATGTPAATAWRP